MSDPFPCSADCQVSSFNEHRLQRLEQSIAHTRTKLDVVGIRLEWLGRKLLSTELEKAELRRTLAERIWEFNLLRHQIRREEHGQEVESSPRESARALSLAD